MPVSPRAPLPSGTGPHQPQHPPASFLFRSGQRGRRASVTVPPSLTHDTPASQLQRLWGWKQGLEMLCGCRVSRARPPAQTAALHQ